jgi:glyoxylase-like metal-dependent hydrolase (beta-lactamase superfamily II)
MNLHRLRLPLPLRLDHLNAYLVEGPEGHALVDTGMATTEGRDALRSALEQHGLSPGDLRQLFITHFHGDHWGLAGWLHDQGVEVVMPRRDSELLRLWLDHPEYDQRSVGEYARRGVSEEVLRGASHSLAGMRRLSPPFVTDRVVDHGETLALGGEPFEVLVTPGHSPGHACLLHRPSDTLICGDHVLPHITPNITWEVGTEQNPLGLYRASLRQVRGLGLRCAWPAHGEAIQDLDRRIDEILAHHEQREALLLRGLHAGPRNAFELCAHLFELARLDSFETWMALGETMAHVVAARESGALLVEIGSDGVERYRRA